MRGVLITGVVDDERWLTAAVPEWMPPGVVRIFVLVLDENDESQAFDWEIFNGTECTVELENGIDASVRIQLDPEPPSTRG